jgi:hypothetical protein
MENVNLLAILIAVVANFILGSGTRHFLVKFGRKNWAWI